MNKTADATNTGILGLNGLLTLNLLFQSSINIDPADYVNPVTSVIDYSVLQSNKAYYLNFVVYFDEPNFNHKSVTAQNDDLHFYLWPKNPCYQAVLFPDENINGGKSITTFIGAPEI